VQPVIKSISFQRPFAIDTISLLEERRNLGRFGEVRYYSANEIPVAKRAAMAGDVSE
jgi:hypothetical protein